MQRLGLFIFVTCSLCWAAILPAQESSLASEHVRRMKAGTAIFKDSVRNLLETRCLECHNAEAKKGDFDLSTRDALVASGHLGDSATDSHLMQLVRHDEEPFMPLKADRLSELQIEQLARWIDLGAPYDKPLGTVDAEQSARRAAAADRQFWSFLPLRHATVPPVDDAGWCRTDIDRYIFSRLREEGIQPNPTAERRMLIRRAYYDLIGLPPTPAEIAQFVNNPDPQAYSRLIDRLLASDHYGERWARHWLDVARFAESSGFEHDDDRPTAYHYRDFVIKAFNNDLPYDEFIRWQLAGDELAPDNPLAMCATGFLGAGVFPTQLTEAEFESARYDELDDMVTNTGLAFLGLSVGCARCHDHKFDPISARDYYGLAASFARTVRSEVELNVEPGGGPTKVQITADGFAPIKNHADGRGYPYFYKDVYLLGRGDVHQKREIAKQSFLPVLMRNDKSEQDWTLEPPPDWKRSDFRRAKLALWITDPENGAGHLAARVIANRLWLHHFGHGLVATPNDFGVQGERPTHPELLDWLAEELIAADWSLKHLHRLIMNSSVYMQSDDFDDTRAGVDPHNRLHWRHTPRRLEAEAIRDAMLSVSALLDSSMYGPGSLDDNMRRRSVYFTIKRSKLIPMMMLYDWPEHLVSIGQRPTTTTAPQALLLMNNRQERAFAAGLAEQLLACQGEQDEDIPQPGYRAAIAFAYQRAYGRNPSDRESALAEAFLRQQLGIHQKSAGEQAEKQALVDFCQAILSANEFIYVR